MTDTPQSPGRSLGRKSIRPSAQPRELMTNTPDLHGVWKARVITLFPTAFPGVLGESLT
ncbi:MAG: tRNA (guanosine(37)-N1)-methyltransferase TrmD, partial [Pseudodonghicola sp.]